ncbi:MAG: hypothetical protein JST55_11640 [Bacteroidetes bacterium]|nr:hypothetical protein [Bacteroidota bacterium]
MKYFKFLIALLIFISTARESYSQSSFVPGLYNTGMDDFNNLLADGETDSHYLLIESADMNYPGPDAKVILSNEFPMGNWYPNGDKSKWIAPRTDAGKWNEEGVYIYRLYFDLTGHDLNSTVIKGGWSTDNNGVDILINGQSTGFATPFEAFKGGLFPFEIKSGFVQGVNTLDFIVNNGYAPTGLRVEFAPTNKTITLR